MFFSSSFCLIKTFRRLRHISPRNLPFLKYKSWKEVLLVRFRVGLDDQEDVFYVVSSRGSQQFIFTKELTPSKMNTIPFITEQLWSKMILLNLNLLTNIQWNFYETYYVLTYNVKVLSISQKILNPQCHLLSWYV